MSKYGRGLSREIVGAVNRGLLKEPFDLDSVREFAISKNWKVKKNYLNVCLSNSAADDHTFTCKKYFDSIGNGQYCLRGKYKSHEWE